MTCNSECETPVSRTNIGQGKGNCAGECHNISFPPVVDVLQHSVTSAVIVSSASCSAYAESDELLALAFIKQIAVSATWNPVQS